MPTLMTPNATITAIDGTAADIPIRLQCLPLKEQAAFAAHGWEADHRALVPPSVTLPQGGTVTIAGQAYRVVRRHAACGGPRWNEALLAALPEGSAV